MNTAICGLCGADIVWAKTSNDTPIPLEVNIRGNIVLDASGFTGPAKGQWLPPDYKVTYLRHPLVCQGSSDEA